MLVVGTGFFVGSEVGLTAKAELEIPLVSKADNRAIVITLRGADLMSI